MPRRKKKNPHLPSRVYQQRDGGAYFYIDFNMKYHGLGSIFFPAMAKWATLVDRPTFCHTMNQLFDRYMIEVAPKKAERSYKDNVRQIQNLRMFFGDMYIEDITPVDIYKYLDIRSQAAPVQANREKALLSHIFSYAIRWGYVKDNPCRNVKRNPEKPRERYVTDAEYQAVYALAPMVIQCIMDFQYLSCQRISDTLRIKLSDLTEDFISVTVSKARGKKLEIEWGQEFRACVDCIRGLKRKIGGMYLFHKQNGQPYTYDGIASAWQRLMQKAMKKNVITETFTIHDLRAKGLTDMDDLSKASALASHSSSRITERVYVRKTKRASPLR